MTLTEPHTIWCGAFLMQLDAVIVQDIVPLGDCEHREGQLILIIRKVPKIGYPVVLGKLVQVCPGDFRHISAFDEAVPLEGTVGLEDCFVVHVGCLLVL